MTDRRRTLSIAALSLTAAVLVAAHVQLGWEPRAVAQEAVGGRDFQLVTAPVQRGGDGLYVLDNRSGFIALLSWNPQARRIEPKDVRPVGELLGGEPINATPR